MEVKVLDLFSGAGGFSKGIEMAGHTITKHYFSEIDKHAIANYLYNFKNAKYYGSVTDVQGKRGEVDIITFGSPCQDFSLAGKRAGMEGQRSSLILEAIRLIDEIRPSIFIWENVKGTFSSNNGADFWAILAAFANIGGYRLEWQLLNTSWFLPQNRERIYLVGHLDGRSQPGVFPIGESDFKNNRIGVNRIGGLYGQACRWGVYDKNELSPTLTASAGMCGGHIPMLNIKSNTKKGYEELKPGDSLNFSVPTSKTRRGRVGKGQAQTLDTQCSQGVINTGTITEAIGRAGSSKEYLKSIENIYNSIGKIRRLTEIECERLQGFPDDWTKYGIYDGEVKEIPKTQRYKLMGNAVTTEVVAEIFRRIKIK